MQSPGGFIYDLHKDSSITEDDGDWLVQWLRGYSDGTAVTTQKKWKLGAVDHSSPALLTPPGKTTWYFGTGTKPKERNSYDVYRTNFSDRRSLLFVGSRDGLLHAFDAGAFRWGNNPLTASTEQLGYFEWDDIGNGYDEPDYGTGEELWAFVPINLLPRLKNNLLDANDRAFVDATATVSHVQMDYASADATECALRGGSLESGVCKDGWHSVLLMAEGNGGDSVFYRDQPKFLWEFTDPDLYRSRTSPNVSKIGRIMVGGKPTWAAFFVSGKTYDDNLYPSIYILDISDGSVIQRIFLDSDVAGKGGVPSGRPSLVDSDQNGYVDRIYLGTDKGRVYKVVLSDDPLASYFDADDVVVNQDFIDETGDVVAGVPVAVEVPTSQRWHPVYAAPTIVNETTINASGYLDYRVRIFFGTGDSPYFDEDIDTGNTTYHFFSYLDTAKEGELGVDNIELDWFYELPAGQRVFASAFASAGQVYFGTSTAETENPCDVSNNGQTYIFEYEQSAAAQPMEPALDSGNISTRLLVDDEKLFISNSTGLKVHGDGSGYEKEKKEHGFGSFSRKAWREVE